MHFFIWGKTKSVKERIGWAVEVTKHPELALQLLVLDGSPCFFFRTSWWLSGWRVVTSCFYACSSGKCSFYLKHSKSGLCSSGVKMEEKKRQKTQRKIISTRMLWIISNLGLFSNCLKQSVFQMCCELQAWFAPDIWILPGTTLFVIFLSSDLRVQPHSHSSFLHKVKDTVVGTGFQSKKEY